VAEDPRFDFATAGKLFRIGRSGSSILRESIGIANTVCWAPSQDLLYFGDSFANVIRVYDYDKRTGGIAGERDFFAQFERGVPDGSAMDQDGYLWNCRFGGACVVRIAPNGRIDRVIEMPVLNITTCTFGGPGLSTLFITTARVGGGTGNRLAGSLFAVDVGTPGLPDFLFDP
jgi:sugar lactone lactonase YvrE